MMRKQNLACLLCMILPREPKKVKNTYRIVKSVDDDGLYFSSYLWCVCYVCVYVQLYVCTVWGVIF